MRRFLCLFLPLLVSLPVLDPPARAADAPATDPAAATHSVRQTWEHRFAGANLAHDGHLTRAEAKGGYATIARHFDDIDVDRKGYVTENDIRAWRVMRKAAHRLGKPSADDTSRPRSAVQRTYPALHTIMATDTRTAAGPGN